MDWIEIISWIVAATLLAGVHVWPRKERLPRVFGIFASAIVGGLIGGMFVHILRWRPFSVGRYSISALVAALVIAEIGILLAFAARSGQRRPPLAGGST